jgi:hypothetical protein
VRRSDELHRSGERERDRERSSRDGKREGDGRGDAAPRSTLTSSSEIGKGDPPTGTATRDDVTTDGLKGKSIRDSNNYEDELDSMEVNMEM